jgi:hypothetical protein
MKWQDERQAERKTRIRKTVRQEDRRISRHKDGWIRCVGGSTVRCTVGAVFPVRAANPECSGFRKRRKAIRVEEGVPVEEGIASDGDVETDVKRGEVRRVEEREVKEREEAQKEEGRGHGMTS